MAQMMNFAAQSQRRDPMAMAMQLAEFGLQAKALQARTEAYQQQAAADLLSARLKRLDSNINMMKAVPQLPTKRVLLESVLRDPLLGLDDQKIQAGMMDFDNTLEAVSNIHSTLMKNPTPENFTNGIMVLSQAIGKGYIEADQGGAEIKGLETVAGAYSKGAVGPLFGIDPRAAMFMPDSVIGHVAGMRGDEIRAGATIGAARIGASSALAGRAYGAVHDEAAQTALRATALKYGFSPFKADGSAIDLAALEQGIPDTQREEAAKFYRETYANDLAKRAATDQAMPPSVRAGVLNYAGIEIGAIEQEKQRLINAQVGAAQPPPVTGGPTTLLPGEAPAPQTGPRTGGMWPHGSGNQPVKLEKPPSTDGTYGSSLDFVGPQQPAVGPTNEGRTMPRTMVDEAAMYQQVDPIQIGEMAREAMKVRESLQRVPNKDERMADLEAAMKLLPKIRETQFKNLGDKKQGEDLKELYRVVQGQIEDEIYYIKSEGKSRPGTVNGDAIEALADLYQGFQATPGDDLAEASGPIRDGFVTPKYVGFLQVLQNAGITGKIAYGTHRLPLTVDPLLNLVILASHGQGAEADFAERQKKKQEAESGTGTDNTASDE